MSKKILKVYKYGTGEKIPEGAIYLNTIAQTKIETDIDLPCLCHNDYQCEDKRTKGFVDCWLVWHYFLVDTNSLQQEKEGEE